MKKFLTILFALFLVVSICIFLFLHSDANTYGKYHMEGLGVGCISDYLKDNWMNSEKHIEEDLQKMAEKDETFNTGKCFQYCDESNCKYYGFIKFEAIHSDVNKRLHGDRNEIHFQITSNKREKSIIASKQNN